MLRNKKKTISIHSHVGQLIMHFGKAMLITLAALWFAGMIIARIYVFHAAYIHHQQTIEDDRWLLHQCKDSTFYANLGQHVDLCTKVRENARKNVFLAALNDTMATASMCGVVSCWDIFIYVQTGGLSLVATIGLILMGLLFVIIPGIHVLSRVITDISYYSEWCNPCIEKGNHDDPHYHKQQHNLSPIVPAVWDSSLALSQTELHESHSDSTTPFTSSGIAWMSPWHTYNNRPQQVFKKNV